MPYQSYVIFFNDIKKIQNMKTPLIAIATIAVLLVSVIMANHAFAEKSGASDVKSIMAAYQKAVYQAQKDFTAAIKKANADARAAVGKGLPIDQINSESKAAIAKARADLKSAKDTAQKEARNGLDKLKASIKP